MARIRTRAVCKASSRVVARLGAMARAVVMLGLGLGPG